MQTIHYPVHFQGTNSFVNNTGSCVQVGHAFILHSLMTFCARAYINYAIVCSITMSNVSYHLPPCPVKASEALVQVSGNMLWMGNNFYRLSTGGAVHLTSHAQLRLHPSANLTFVANSGR